MTKHQHGSIMWAILCCINCVNGQLSKNETVTIIQSIFALVCAAISLYHWIAVDREEK